jgi:hypothetical protein
MAMKRTMIVLGVALAGALMSASAQVSFTHLKSVDLSRRTSPRGGQQGDLASDVAFDGANLYIAGMSNGELAGGTCRRSQNLECVVAGCERLGLLTVDYA